MSEQNNTIISGTGLDVFLNRGQVLFDLNFEIKKGEIFGAVGPNGSGKSTLLRMIAGLIKYRGTLIIGGELPGSGDVAYVPQRPELPTGMCVAEYVLMGRNRHLGWFGAEKPLDRKLVHDVLVQLNLLSHASHEVSQLSGGEMQRVVLARALAQQAKILVLDEPTSALDLGYQVGVMNLINQLREAHGLTIVVALHDLTLASRFCDKVMLLQKGRCLAMDVPAKAFNEELLTRLYGTPIQLIVDAHGQSIVAPVLGEGI